MKNRSFHFYFPAVTTATIKIGVLSGTVKVAEADVSPFAQLAIINGVLNVCPLKILFEKLLVRSESLEKVCSNNLSQLLNFLFKGHY